MTIKTYKCENKECDYETKDYQEIIVVNDVLKCRSCYLFETFNKK